MTSTLSAPPVSTPLAGRTAAVAVTALFFVNGMLLGGWGGALPALRERLGLSATQIALMLFCGGVAAIASMQIGGRLADAVGARRVTLGALPLLVLAALTLAVAPVFAVAVLGGVLLGLGNGAMDVSMNALGVQVEAARRKPIMSFFHAFFSVGSFVGAGAVLLLSAAFGLTGAEVVAPVMVTLAVLAAAALMVLLRITPHAAPVAHVVDGVRTKIPRIAWVLGVMGLAFGL
ncbi:MAG: MFS transporter, partial [Actinomycetes bacterium]